MSASNERGAGGREMILNPEEYGQGRSQADSYYGMAKEPTNLSEQGSGSSTADKVASIFDAVMAKTKIEHGGGVMRRAHEGVRKRNWDADHPDKQELRKKLSHDYANGQGLAGRTNPSSWIIYWCEQRSVMYAQNRGRYCHDYLVMAGAMWRAMTGHQKLVYEMTAEKFRQGFLPERTHYTFEMIQACKKALGFCPIPQSSLEPIDQPPVPDCTENDLLLVEN